MKLLYNLLQDFLSARDHNGEQSLIFIQANCKWFNIVSSSSKDTSYTIYHSTFIPNKHWDCTAPHPIFVKTL